MSRVCQICGKKTRVGHKRSHSNIATKRRFKPNLQKVLYKGKKVLACTSCIKSLYKEKK